MTKKGNLYVILTDYTTFISRRGVKEDQKYVKFQDMTDSVLINASHTDFVFLRSTWNMMKALVKSFHRS